MGGKEKEVKRKYLEPKGESARYLGGGREIRAGIWLGLRVGAPMHSGRGKGHSAKLGGNRTACWLWHSTEGHMTHLRAEWQPQ